MNLARSSPSSAETGLFLKSLRKLAFLARDNLAFDWCEEITERDRIFQFQPQIYGFKRVIYIKISLILNR